LHSHLYHCHEFASQIEALKQGLGLSTPDEVFWKPLGMLTAAMQPKDKVILLADLIPYFDGDANTMTKLMSLPSEVRAALSHVQSVCQGMEAGDAQLVSVDLAVTDYLPLGLQECDKFGRWIKVGFSNCNGVFGDFVLFSPFRRSSSQLSWRKGNGTRRLLSSKKLRMQRSRWHTTRVKLCNTIF
jgi:hypothetical protein